MVSTHFLSKVDSRVRNDGGTRPRQYGVQILFVSDRCRKFRRRTNARWGHVGLNKSRPRRTGGEEVDRAWN